MPNPTSRSMQVLHVRALRRLQLHAVAAEVTQGVLQQPRTHGVQRLRLRRPGEGPHSAVHLLPKAQPNSERIQPFLPGVGGVTGCRVRRYLGQKAIAAAGLREQVVNLVQRQKGAGKRVAVRRDGADLRDHGLRALHGVFTPARNPCCAGVGVIRKGCRLCAHSGHRIRIPRAAGRSRCPRPALRQIHHDRRPVRWRGTDPRCRGDR